VTALVVTQASPTLLLLRRRVLALLIVLRVATIRDVIVRIPAMRRYKLKVRLVMINPAMRNNPELNEKRY
jgi:hypothetical protein